MMSDVSGSEKTALHTSVESAIADDHHPVDPPPRDYVSRKRMNSRRLTCNEALINDHRNRCGPQARYSEPR
jgi:hypothetical protein